MAVPAVTATTMVFVDELDELEELTVTGRVAPTHPVAEAVTVDVPAVVSL